MLKLIHKKQKEQPDKFNIMFKKFATVLSLILIFAIIAAVTSFDAYFVEPKLLFVKHKTLYLPHWDKKLDGLKIAVISDLHLGTKRVDVHNLKTIIQKTNQNNPDLIFLLGDFDSKTIKIKYSTEALSKVFKTFKSKYSTIAILGNHDYATPGPEQIKKILKNANIQVLENKTTNIQINGRSLYVTGFKDTWYFDINPAEILGKNIKTPTIVLMHNPDTFPEIPDKISLSLSGHTHGGEINIPGLGSPITPSKYGQRYRKGYIVENNKHLYVTGGIATLSGFRLFNPPEIVILTIYSQNEKTKIINTKPQKGFNSRVQLEKIYHFAGKIYKKAACIL